MPEDRAGMPGRSCSEGGRQRGRRAAAQQRCATDPSPQPAILWVPPTCPCCCSGGGGKPSVRRPAALRISIDGCGDRPPTSGCCIGGGGGVAAVLPGHARLAAPLLLRLGLGLACSPGSSAGDAAGVQPPAAAAAAAEPTALTASAAAMAARAVSEGTDGSIPGTRSSSTLQAGEAHAWL